MSPSSVGNGEVQHFERRGSEGRGGSGGVGGLSARLMSMQTGSTRGHHLANYHCWRIGADLNCHRKTHHSMSKNARQYVSMPLDVPHSASRTGRGAGAVRCGWVADDGRQRRDKATWSAPQTGQGAARPPARFTFLEDAQCQPVRLHVRP